MEDMQIAKYKIKLTVLDVIIERVLHLPKKKKNMYIRNVTE